MKTIVNTLVSTSLMPRAFLSTTVNQILEALRLQRRCQGNMVMVPLELHAAACWEKDEGRRRRRRAAEALSEDPCVLRQQVKVHQDQAHC